MYFVLQCDRPDDDSGGWMDIEDWTGVNGFKDWRVGRIARDRPGASPTVISAVPHDGYQGLPRELSDNSVPLMSARLKAAIEGAGVDNIDYHPVTLRNSATAATYPYYAFNLIGLVSATDFRKSVLESYDGDFKGDSAIKHLVLDPSKTGALLMFRLAEKFSTILIHARVREAIERAGIDTLRFTKPEDFYHL